MNKKSISRSQYQSSYEIDPISNAVQKHRELDFHVNRIKSTHIILYHESDIRSINQF